MPFNETSRKIGIKYSRFSGKDKLFFRKRLYWTSFLCLPLGWYYPNSAIFVAVVLFLFGIWVTEDAPRPMFDSIKKKWKLNKAALPFLYIGDDEFKFPIEIPAANMRQHMLLMGSTGSGKTAFLRRMIHTQLQYGGGCCFVDGKADTSDMYQIFFGEALANDREEDFYLLNFMDASQSHTFNPFLYGDSDFLVEVLNGLLKEAQGDNVYWQERAITMMRAYMSTLVWLRDNRPEFVLNVSSINNNMNLNAMVNFAKDNSIPDHDANGKPVKIRMKVYLESLSPNWMHIGTKQMPPDEMSELSRQFGYGVQQWSPAFDLLSAVYGKIFDTEVPDIDIRDVVLNNKILYILLPALRQSPQTLKSLGRLCLSVFRIVFVELLGDKVIGDTEDIYNDTGAKKPDPPYLFVLDEYGSYAVEGMDTILAQARSTGVSVVISVQETASLFKLNEVEAKRLLNNTKLKICLAIDDKDSSKYFVERVGEDWTFIPSVKREYGDFTEMMGNIDGGFSYQKVERLQDLELYGLNPGHGFILYQNDFRKFYSPELKPKRPKRMRLLRFIKKVSSEVFEAIRERFKSFRIGNVIINKWDDKETKWLMSAHNDFGIFPTEIEEAFADTSDGFYEEQNFDYMVFLEELKEDMINDERFAKFYTPDMALWEEFKGILLSY